MLRAVTPIYNDEYQLSIFNANGMIMEEVLQFINKVGTETRINNATWSLPYWESIFRIKPTDTQTIEQRRRNVILKMNEYFPVTKNRMETIINTFVENQNASVIDVPEEYAFIIRIPHTSGSIDSGLFTAVEEVKPAHLQSLYRYVFEVPSITVGARQHVYPVSYPKTNQSITTDNGVGVNSESKIHIPTKTYGYEVIYPVTGMAFCY